MSNIDLIGFIGVLLILIAYFGNINNKLESDNIIYILLNMFGGMLACLASLLMEFYPFVLLEGTWAIVSFGALIKYIKNGQSDWRNEFGRADS